ncbi:hypothetical protein [Curtobacterium sp. UCD-KPL2560]|uniref:hypothetical protein n=1 Tax=Curtobacterium sp. UCD-KPL2560 TaxID=1885315 RepID=UPI000824E32C|nr:hypothetical protein [Curtobacterium sp. UCD-KPL2560]
MAAKDKVFVRHTHTGEIREVTSEQRDVQDKNYWVRITGDVKPTQPEADGPAEAEMPAPKTTPKATTPKE